MGYPGCHGTIVNILELARHTSHHILTYIQPFILMYMNNKWLRSILCPLVSGLAVSGIYPAMSIIGKSVDMHVCERFCMHGLHSISIRLKGVLFFCCDSLKSVSSSVVINYHTPDVSNREQLLFSGDLEW